MTATLVRDSIMQDSWIRQVATDVPVARRLGADGNPTGDIITGPVRLAFCESLTGSGVAPASDSDKPAKHGALLLFTPFADMRIFYEEYYAACGREFASHYDAQSQQFSGLVSPFKAQDEKLKYNGFTPGCVYISSSSQFPPSIVDTRYNPIVDPRKIYAGVWAICAVKPYAYGKAGKTKDGQPMKKGIGFGLQSVMIIGDDNRFGGGQPDAKEMFSGVKITPPTVGASSVAGMPMGVGAPPPAAGIPGYTQMGGGYNPNQPPQPHYQGQMAAPAQYAAAVPMGAPAYPPPMPAGYAVPPAGGAGYAPPATSYPIESEDERMMREMGLA